MSRTHAPRPARSFAPDASPLEGRTLPSTLGPVDLAAVPATVVPAPEAPFVGPVALAVTDPGPSTVGVPTHQEHQGGPIPGSPGPGPGPGPRPPMANRVAMAEADIRVGGQPTQEFAFAGPNRGVVVVKVGRDGPSTLLSARDGIKRPGAIALADVNGDGLPDLIVANSGADNVLVFPGLPGGGVGPEVNGGAGFAVGQRPSGITVGDVNGDGLPDLVVANRESDNVTLLLGQGQGPDWSLVPGQTLPAGTAPVRTALHDVNSDGNPDLFILNSGSNDVTMYRGVGGGQFDTADPTSFAVGLAPSELFVGRFDHRPGLDLVTVNSGSDDVTFIAGIATEAPRTASYPSGGTSPEAAFAIDLNHDGVLDLVVANSGDGRLALLQGTDNGLRLAGVISRPDLPAPTALAPGDVTQAGLDFFAAGAGQEAAELLHFDLGPASAFLAPPASLPGDSDQAETDLIAQLLPFGESDLVLIAILREGDRPPRATPPDRDARGPSPIASSPTDESAEEQASGAVPSDPAPESPPADDPVAWIRYVLGLDRALGSPRGRVEALAARDTDEPGDRDEPGPDRPDRPAVDADFEAAASAVDEALRSIRSDVTPPTPEPADLEPAGPGPARDPRREETRGAEAPRPGPDALSIPLLATSLLVASRVILRATPPRPPSSRPGARRPRAVPGRTSRQ